MKKIFLLSALLLTLTVLYGQDNCGCNEAETLRAPMGMHFNSGRLDSAEFYTKKLLGFKEKGCALFYQDWMAQISIAKKDFTAGRDFLSKEKKWLDNNGCDKVRYYSTLSRLYQELNLFDSLIITYINGIDASEKANDQYGLSRASSDLASAFSQSGQMDKAFSYYRKAIEAGRKQTKMPTLVATIQTRFSNEYLALFKKSGEKKYADSASLLAKEALDTAAKYQDLITWLEANNSLAEQALLTNEPAKTIHYAEAMIASCPKGVHLFDRLLYEAYSKRSKAGYQLENYQQAELFADSAMIYGRAFNPQMEAGACEALYLAAKANGHIEKSLAVHERMTRLNDSLFTIANNKTITELEKKYNQVKNENTIKDLSKKKQLYLFLAVAGVLMAIAIAFFLRQQSLKHKKNILETEQRLNRARMNPHFFFNALTALQKFAVRENDNQALASNLSRFSNIMRETLESTYKEYVTIEQELEFLNEYLEVQKIRFPQTFRYEVTAADDVETDELLIPSMIIQPFIENSIEHGFAGIDYPGEVVVHFSKKNTGLLVHITDNGKGLSSHPAEQTNHISRASQIIKDRIYLLNIKLKTKAGFSIANNEIGNGVKVDIHLPLLYTSDEKK